MEQFVAFVFTYGALILSVALATALVCIRPASRAARRCLMSVVGLYTLASLYVVPYGVSRMLVAGFHEFVPADPRPTPTAIVLLGSGAGFVRGWDGKRFTFLDGVSAARVSEAFRVYNLLPDAWVISSGGSVSSRPGAATTGGTMREALLHRGVPASRVLLEDTSQSTRDEAVLLAPMLRTLKVGRVILVTSDFHMRRALSAFRAAGVDAVPAIAMDPLASRPWGQWLWPSNQGLIFSGSVTKEFLATGFYWSRGWIRF